MILTGDEGCRTMRTRMRTMTMHGNSRTTPRGMEIDELPLMRMRRRKKARRGDIRSFWREMSSSEGRLGEEGILFTISWTSPIRARERRLPRHRCRSKVTDGEETAVLG